VFLTYVVGRLAPFHRTEEPAKKFAPVTVRVKAGPPTMVVSDEREVRVGAGFAVLGPWSCSVHTSRNGAVWFVPP
jgi:hypothetical protein